MKPVNSALFLQLQCLLLWTNISLLPSYEDYLCLDLGPSWIIQEDHRTPRSSITTSKSLAYKVNLRFQGLGSGYLWGSLFQPATSYTFSRLNVNFLTFKNSYIKFFFQQSEDGHFLMLHSKMDFKIKSSKYLNYNKLVMILLA